MKKILNYLKNLFQNGRMKLMRKRMSNGGWRIKKKKDTC